jgi:6-phosphogluconate dehydrogenase
MTAHADIGLIGLGVMGRNLVLNMDDHGYTVSVFNRTVARVDEFLAQGAAGTKVIGTHDLEGFVDSLQRPRRVMLMVKAGTPVDAQIEAIRPLLETGDIIIDGGNSNYRDTMRRTRELQRVGIRFVGMGISGGEEGARFGPSIMPGGNADAWPEIEDLFRDIAATADGEPMCEWVGPDGAGHYVKMVHNGIEYGDMEVIAEAYDLMGRGLGMTAPEMQPVFAEWNTGTLDSYLIEITTSILGTRDTDGEPLVDKILDVAGQKGTGRWTVVSSMDEAMPVSLIAEAVYSRMVSALDAERTAASAALDGPSSAIPHDREQVVLDLHDALYASKIVSYAQGFMLLRAASNENDWDLDLGTIASLWRAGCIIRSRFLADITAAYRDDPNLVNLLLAPYFSSEIGTAQAGWRRTVARAAEAGIPTPAYGAALSFYDAYRSARLPANLIQAQRDFFGAHTYERVDRERGEFFHTEW